MLIVPEWLNSMSSYLWCTKMTRSLRKMWDPDSGFLTKMGMGILLLQNWSKYKHILRRKFQNNFTLWLSTCKWFHPKYSAMKKSYCRSSHIINLNIFQGTIWNWQRRIFKTFTKIIYHFHMTSTHYDIPAMFCIDRIFSYA